MADNVEITPGLGIDISTDELGDGSHAQQIKLLYSADGVATRVPADADGMLVNLGTNNDVTITSSTALTPGTAAANLGKAVDAVPGASDTGVAALAVRDDALATLTPVDGDYTHVRVDSTGALWVRQSAAVALAAGAASIGTLGSNSGVDVGDVTINNSTGASAVNIQDGGNTITVDGTVTVGSITAGDNNIGNVDVVSLPALVAGTANIGDVDILTIAAGDNNIGNVDVVTLPALPSGSNNIGDVDVLTLPGILGTIAHDSADSGAPVKTGARARSTDVTATTADDRVDSVASLVGKHVVLPYALPGQHISGTTNYTTGSAADVIAAQAAGVRIYVTQVTVVNGHASQGTKVSIRDGTTVKYVGFAAPAGGGFSISFPVALRGSAATALTAICGTSGADVDVNVSGYIASE